MKTIIANTSSCLEEDNLVIREIYKELNNQLGSFTNSVLLNMTNKEDSNIDYLKLKALIQSFGKTNRHSYCDGKLIKNLPYYKELPSMFNDLLEKEAGAIIFRVLLVEMNRLLREGQLKGENEEEEYQNFCQEYLSQDAFQKYLYQ